MRELRARLCYLLVLVCLWVCRLLSRSIAFGCLSIACLCLSLLAFGFRRRPTGVGRAGSRYFGRGELLADASI
jgi:hypothetical protein